MNTLIRPALVLFAALTVVTGLAYPLFVTLAAQVVFPHEAHGSLVRDAGGQVVGSELIGQSFDAPQYLWGRPSVTSPSYNGAASTGSNQGPTNPDLLKALGDRVQAIRTAHPDQTGPVPADLVTASASGLDPHISPAAAEYQVERIAKTRGVTPEDVRDIVHSHTRSRTLGVLGEPRMNVLLVNRDLDAKFPTPAVK